MKIEFDTDTMIVSVEGVDDIEVADIVEALQVIEAAAVEMMNEEVEPAEGEMAEEDALLEEVPADIGVQGDTGAGRGRGSKRKSVQDMSEEDAMMEGYK